MFGIKRLIARIAACEGDLSRWYSHFASANYARNNDIIALQKDVKLLRDELASRPVMVSPAELAKLKEAAARDQVNTAMANVRHDLLFPNQVPANKIDIGN